MAFDTGRKNSISAIRWWSFQLSFGADSCRHDLITDLEGRLNMGLSSGACLLSVGETGEGA